MNQEITPIYASWNKIIFLVLLIVLIFNLLIFTSIFAVVSNYTISIELGERLAISLKELIIDTHVEDEVKVHIDSNIAVPINADIDVPISTNIFIDEVFDVEASVPVSISLTENELQLANIAVPIDTYFPIDESIQIDTTVPIDSVISTYGGLPVKVKVDLPIQATIPIKQDIRVKKDLLINLNQFQIDLNFELPINTLVAIKKPIKAASIIPIKVDTIINAPIKAKVPINIAESFQTAVNVKYPMSIESGKLILDLDAISILEH